MPSKAKTLTYVAFLRGINVGGHKKVPMAELKEELAKLGYKNIITILNSGNVIFEGKAAKTSQIEEIIAPHLEGHFGFTIPTIVRTAQHILELLQHDPFQNFETTKETRFYTSFLKDDVKVDIKLPWVSEDQSYQILARKDKTILSVLDLSITKTPQAMEALEKIYGKRITTRNWKTILRIEKKLNN